MNEETRREIEALKARIDALERPITISNEMQRALVSAGFLRQIRRIRYTSAANADLWSVFVEAGILGSKAPGTNKEQSPMFVIGANPGEYYYEFTADPSTDRLTFQGKPFSDNTPIWVLTTGTLPGGLSESVQLYTRDTSGSTFKVSTSPGGTAIDITSSGIGAHWFSFQQ